MKDEVLKPFDVDNYVDDVAIPRYDIVLPSGETLYHGVQFILCNDVVEPGTPLNRKNLLSDDTSRALGLDPDTSTPDEALKAIMRSVGYCPRVAVDYIPEGTVHVKNVATQETKTYIVPKNGRVTVDILEYGYYEFWGSFYDSVTPTETLGVDTTKIYQVRPEYAYSLCQLFVEYEVGAVITFAHPDGFTITGTVGSDKTCTVTIPKTGEYTVVGLYNGCASQTKKFTFDVLDNSLLTTSIAWLTVIVRAETGSTVTVTSGDFTVSGVTAGGQIQFWLPNMGTYSITASLNGKSTTGSVVASEYKNYNVTLRYL